MNKALIVIDLQKDYMPGGSFPLWNTDEVLSNITQAIEKANEKNIPVIFIKHVADGSKGKSLFFNEGTKGEELLEDIVAMAHKSAVVIKRYADGFYETVLDDLLKNMNIDELLICGMMTQNCVTHTAISKNAEKYNVLVIGDCSTTVSKEIHLIALNALKIRVPVINLSDVSW